jgi:hypothetical protein
MGDSGTSEVDGARCDGPDRCVLAGVTEGRLAVWELRPDGHTQPPGIPAVDIPENGTVPSPVTVGGDDVVVAPSGSGSTVVRVSRDFAWTIAPGPDGAPTSVVAHGDELWVVTTDARGSTTLWRARVA